MKPTPRFALGAVVVALCAVHAPRAHAQDWFSMATWQISFPTGDTQKFTDDVSVLGAGLDFRRVITGGTVGSVGMAWNVFHQRTSSTILVESGAVSGSQDRYINSFPVMIGLHQYFGRPRKTRMHVGLNGGGFVLIQTFRIGISEFEQDEWEWGLAPEVGVTIPFTTGAWFEVQGRYQWSPTPEDMRNNEVDLTYFQLNVGFVWEQ